MANSDFRNKAGWVIATVVVVILAVTGILLLVPRLTADEPPFDADAVPGTQVLWVTAPRGADHGTLELWQRGSRWKRTLSTSAWVGREGISPQAREGSAFTPEGTFTVSEAFGRLADTRSRLPYLPVDSSNTWWWVSDTASPLYNQKYQCLADECPFDTSASENLGETDPQYNYALVIDYNRAPVVEGRGSAFFVHVAVGKPTPGLVAGPGEGMRTQLTTQEAAR
ncbi:hypothetical protein [Nocardia wallacei]|uniref:hypothetical protein n=1 Tax=Nocardia wallacei TaxID=480035 RepID=UPI002458A824|nr:hypothetical protein [Nocardia wallacei]